MISLTKINPVARAVIVIGAVMALVTSITFAALQSQATLTANTISTATAELLLWDGDSFESTAPGFTMENLVPGEESDPFLFYFKNSGGVDLDLTARIPTLPSTTGLATYEDVVLRFSSQDCPDVVITNMQALFDGEVVMPCNPLDAGSQGVIGDTGNDANYSVTAEVEEDGVTGNGADIGAFDIRFTGTQAIEVSET